MFSVKYLKLRHTGTAIRIYRTHSVHTFSNKRSLYGRCVNFLFKENLTVTNSITSGIFMGLGDMIHQEYQYRTKVITKRYEWDRIKRMFIVGAILGFGHHFYYFYLDVLIPKRSLKTALQKVALDQFFCAPVTIVAFFYILGALEGNSLSESTDEFLEKSFYVYTGDCMFWPPIQIINFYFLPSEYRVFYINVATMVFDVFLSLMKHYDNPT